MFNISRKHFIYPFAILIFTSAFLVFQIQPIIAKMLLPLYGGTPSVWTTCVLFFQIGLLTGYGYTHILVKNVKLKHQLIIHSCLLAISLLLIPIMSNMPKAPQNLSQTLGIIQVLAFSVGLPFILLSASSPLFQYWFGAVYSKKSPYRLYALSNIGSLLGLLSYPFVIETVLPLSTQILIWSFGYLSFIGMTIWWQCQLVKVSLGKNYNEVNDTKIQNKKTISFSSVHSPKFLVRIIWLFLTAGGSIVLLAFTNKMCQDIAALPFLWVVPLCLYLITFILCFERDALYQRNIWFPFLILSVSLCGYLLHQEYEENQTSLIYQIIIYCAALFGCCMVFHGELVRRRPAKQDLTLFYIHIALGGALGGLFVNFIAPIVFSGYWELHISLVLVWILAMVILATHNHAEHKIHILWIKFYLKRHYSLSIGSVGIVILIWVLGRNMMVMKAPSIFNTRSFFGVLHVFEYDKETSNHFRILKHGRVGHGVQWMHTLDMDKPTAYYGSCSAVALAINRFPLRSNNNLVLKVGAIGLGIGTIATYGQNNDIFRFYEINSDVDWIARDYFTYLKNSKANIDVIIGDARQTMKRELETTGSQNYDIILVDAFNGDAIPTHLLTQEASDLYWEHLNEDGILAFHITNKQFDLSDVVRQLAIYTNKEAISIIDDGKCDDYSVKNFWILITSNQTFINDIQVQKAQNDWEFEPKPIIWTDDFNNLFEIVKW